MELRVLRTATIKEGKLDIKPEFYRNIVGGAGINITDGGGIVNSTVIPIVKKITGVSIGGTPASPVTEKIYHGLGKRHFAFMRFHGKEGEEWLDTWSMHKDFNITENHIYVIACEDMKFEIYFTNEFI